MTFETRIDQLIARVKALKEAVRNAIAELQRNRNTNEGGEKSGTIQDEP